MISQVALVDNFIQVDENEAVQLEGRVASGSRSIAQSYGQYGGNESDN